jgi:acetylornithine deacetylase/succinyl-diaminopimelate desuccinylase-like protein
MIETDLRAETARLLADLIRIDTTNPPGNETAAAEHLAAYLAEAGVHAELRGRSPERQNLVARLPGTGEGPSLMLLGHTDVVLADPANGRCRRSRASSVTATSGAGARST